MTTELTADFVRRFPGGLTIRAALAVPVCRFSVTALYGPSGSGKTTVLRCVAGLDRIDDGYIRFGAETWSDTAAGVHLPPQRRGVGYLPQDYALFPHLSVAANIGYGVRGVAAAERRRRVAAMINLFGLAGLEARYTRQLSGGEQQRTALARCLVCGPRLLLLDEPLSALDAPTRDPLRRELRRRLARAAIPTLLVTHDPVEAQSLADTVVVLDGGCVRQCGPVETVFERPADTAVARIVGVETVQRGRVLSAENGRVTVGVGTARLTALFEGAMPAECHVCIRAQNVTLMNDIAPDDGINRLSGEVRAVLPEGPMMRIEVDCGFPLAALVPRQAWLDLGAREGDRVTAQVPPQAIHLLPSG
jgi:molybdate transport system ATP-binding protein